MKKIAIVVQRYGTEVNGGAELYARQIAELLRHDYEVDVLTTCAEDYITWEDVYDEGITTINGVNVHRFKVDEPRNIRRFIWLNRMMSFKCLRKRLIEDKWIDAQGPKSSALIQYIGEHEQDYQCFIFVTYLYYHTVRGLKSVADKAILIPTAHDEPPIYFDRYRQVFSLPRGIIYLTEEEREFVWNQFHNQGIPSSVMALGIDAPKNIRVSSFKEKHGLDDYMVYVGRIDVQKGCEDLFDYFIKYKENHKNNVKLILMGKAAMTIPEHEDIISLGFVSEEDKWAGISGARALILPSQYESLSISVLESLAVGVPVIVNGKSEVLRGHCTRSHAGVWYEDSKAFEGCCEKMLENSTEYETMKAKGPEYIEKFYGWDRIREGFKEMIEMDVRGE